MLNKELMSPAAVEAYESLIDALKEIRKEHKKLIKKAKDKTITSDEVKQLHDLIKNHNKIEKASKAIWDSHSLVNKILKEKKN